jgi:hypothetical protein
MARSRRQQKQRSKAQRRSRNQRGGGDYTGGYGNYAFTGPAGVSAGGVPFESRAADNSHCGWTLRTPPDVSPVGAFHSQNQMGGTRKQRGGGGCGCNQRGGGGGTGGYSFDFGNNALGKVYASLPVGPCPPTPVATPLGTVPLYQQGGSDSYRDLAAIDSYKTGYEFGPRGVVSTSSAHYVDPIGYDRTCKGGARRNRTRKQRKQRKQRNRK